MKINANVILFCSLAVSFLSATAEPVSLFDGKTLEGWNGNYRYFRIEDGAIVGGMLHKRIPRNEFLTPEKEYSNFELRLKFKLVGPNVNAGIQFRSRRIPEHHEMIGYQADLGQRFWGSLYDESRRRKILAQANMDELSKVLDKDGWNDYVISCEGKRIQLWINGYQTLDYTEPDDAIEQTGLIGLQIHSGTAGEAWYKDITIEELPESRAALQPGVRGVATRAPATMKIDGDLSEFKDAFGAPLEYFHPQLKERAAQFFYMWDEEAFYAGLRTLDSKPANHAPDDRLWEGDGVEWYFDTRRGEDFRNREWGKGSVHCYWVGLNGDTVKPRFCLRPGYLDAIPKEGVEVGARRTDVGMEVEFKLPWSNFSGFTARLNEVIALDSELCYSDGEERVDRSFTFGSPLSVQQPASLGKVQLVDDFLPEYWKACGPILAPIRCDTAWTQTTLPRVTAYMAIPPNHSEVIGRVLFRVVDPYGSMLGDYIGTIETFEAAGNFQRAMAEWPSDHATPGAQSLLGIIYDKEGNELARVVPRMVSVGMRQGY